MSKQAIQSPDAPAAIGPYSQAIRAGDTLYLSGQIPLDPTTMQIVDGGIDAQACRVFDNLQAVARAAHASLDDIVKLIREMDFPLANCKYLIATHADVDHVQALKRAKAELAKLEEEIQRGMKELESMLG